MAKSVIQDPAPLQIVLIHDHPTMANGARELLNSLLVKWAPDVDLHRDEWAFAELEHPQCRSEALELSRHCDIFIVALAGIADLPASFIEWLNDWYRSRAQMETALILVVPRTGEDVSRLPFCAILPLQAREHGLSYFLSPIDLPESPVPPTLHPKTLLARLAETNPELLPDFSGINE